MRHPSHPDSANSADYFFIALGRAGAKVRAWVSVSIRSSGYKSGQNTRQPIHHSHAKLAFSYFLLGAATRILQSDSSP